MLPNPLHPAVVHFPIVLMLLLPVMIAGAFWAIRRGVNARRAWSLPVLTAAALLASNWAAVETGEEQTERVERVVAEQPIETHEEGAELFFTLSGVLVVIAVGGMIRGAIGQGARVVTAAAAIGLAIVGARVGHSGGELVYTHGAASAYTQPNANQRSIGPSHVGEAGGEVRER